MQGLSPGEGAPKVELGGVVAWRPELSQLSSEGCKISGSELLVEQGLVEQASGFNVMQSAFSPCHDG